MKSNKQAVKSKIYWANALFSQSDREFNARCAHQLRAAGHGVFLPQEAAVNKQPATTVASAVAVFRLDTAAILDSDVVIACIDQESIDCGVACEVGVAFSFGIPVIGLYTDIRQHRSGPGRMYKNLYVLGAIESAGVIVSSTDDLLHTLAKGVRPANQGRTAKAAKLKNHFSSVAVKYDDFVASLEKWYEPPWSAESVVRNIFDELAPKRVLEVGCGTGALCKAIFRNANTFYIGYDSSQEMIRLANIGKVKDQKRFTTSWSEVRGLSKRAPFDLALLLFTLHDECDQLTLVKSIVKCLRPGGTLLIIDLARHDLSWLTEFLRRRLARPFGLDDHRMDLESIRVFARASGCQLDGCTIATTSVRFPARQNLLDYLNIFGIPEGMDLPLGLESSHTTENRRLITEAVNKLKFPVEDQRAFLTCKLRKL